jgi:predicted O-methyltransferase YrrM
MQWRLRTTLARFVDKIRTLNAWLHRPNIYRIDTPERLGIIYNAPTHLSTPERLFLYTLVRGTLPHRVLEIGTALGGSAAIIAAAMEDNGVGIIIGIDPERRVNPNLPRYHGRFHLIQSVAPRGVEEAARLAGGKFELVFYDGPNVQTATRNIIAAIIPHLSERAYIVVDNGFHYGVHQALTEAIKTDERLHDCGFVCVKLGVHDRHVAYNGLQLVRFDRNPVSDPQPIIEREYHTAGLPVPAFDPETVNHDGWWCRTIQACPKCARGEPSNSLLSDGESDRYKSTQSSK